MKTNHSKQQDRHDKSSFLKYFCFRNFFRTIFNCFSTFYHSIWNNKLNFKISEIFTEKKTKKYAQLKLLSILFVPGDALYEFDMNYSKVFNVWMVFTFSLKSNVHKTSEIFTKIWFVFLYFTKLYMFCSRTPPARY